MSNAPGINVPTHLTTLLTSVLIKVRYSYKYLDSQHGVENDL